MNSYSSQIVATGSYLPERILTNHELSQSLDTSDDWITSRSGIKQRHIIDPSQLTSDLATKAAEDAIESSNISKEDIDLIIVCTTTPDQTFPSVAVKVQANLKIKNIPCFDIQAVCSGFVYALSVADSFIRSGSYKTILIIAAESMSRILNWQDRSTCVLFGDGAGAVIIRAQDANKHQGIILTKILADGSQQSILHTDGGISQNKHTGIIKMNGKEVFKHAVDKMSNMLLDLLKESNIKLQDIDMIVPHQANLRILEAISHKLNFPMEKMAMSLDKHANTSAASIPLALDDYAKSGKIKNNDLVMLTALGAGLTWGGAILRWNLEIK